MATMYTANHLGVKVTAALTEPGSTPPWMSRVSSGIPIYALTDHGETRRKVTLYRCLYPVSFDSSNLDTVQANREIIDELPRRGAVRDEDLVVITKGDLTGVAGGTNAKRSCASGTCQSRASIETPALRTTCVARMHAGAGPDHILDSPRRSKWP